MAKKILYGKEAREKLLIGVEKLYKAVSTTLGPKGRNVAIERKWGAPLVVHDGVTVAKEIDLEDPFENMGAQLVKEAASKTNDVAGDGTTTSTILAYHLAKMGFESPENSMVLRKKMLEESKILVKRIKEKAVPVKESDMEKVATISAQDPKIGKIVAEALKKVGKDGITTIEEGQSMETTIEYKEGMNFDKGYMSAYFVTNSDRMEAAIEEPYILITDTKITSLDQIVGLLESLVKISKNLVIICDDMDGEVLAALVLNKIRGVMNILAVKAPGFGDRKHNMLEDIATLTNGRLISEAMGSTLEGATVEDLGQATKIITTENETTIIGGEGKLDDQIAKIRKQLKSSTADFDREKLQERLAKLTSGVAIINVGATTEIEMKEKKERVIDAVAATKAALEEGILPGGATALINLSEGLKMTEAFKQPFRVLMENSGLDIPKAKFRFGEGINVENGTYDNMIEAGIIEPAKVVRSAVENAVSVATMILTTEVLIVDVEEKIVDK